MIFQNTNTFHHLEDAALVQLAKTDERAFSEIYRRYYTILLNVAIKRLETRPLAEDLVQDIFISLYQKIHYLEISCSIKAYLNKAIRFKIMNEYRSKSVRMRYCKNVFSVSFCKNDFSNIEVKELSKKLNSVYDRLPKKCKQVFLLSRQEGLSQKDISIQLDISLSTVEKHIGKALKIFKEELVEYRPLIQSIA